MNSLTVLCLLVVLLPNLLAMPRPNPESKGQAYDHQRIIENNKRHVNDQNEKKVVCYFPNWGQYRDGVGRFVVGDIDPFLCTHVVYAFAKIEGTALAPYEPNDFVMYQQMQLLKAINPTLKLILSVGGATMGNDPFIYVSSTPTTRELFAANCVAYARTHGFDGIDIDWEYPRPEDRDNFTEMIKELKLHFVMEGIQSGRPIMRLSAAFAASEYYIHNSYDLMALGMYLDMANVMSYDLHGGWDPVTGFHSALHGYYYGDKFSQEWVINEYVTRGMPASLIMLGVPTYGRTFTLCSPNDHDVRDCASGYGQPGQYTETAGTLAFYEICKKLESEFTREYDTIQEVPYAYGGNQWVGYEDARSVLVKAQYVHDLSLGGVVFWDLSMDDFSNRCGSGDYPLIRTAKTAFDGTPTRPPTTTTSPTTTRTTTTQTPSVSSTRPTLRTTSTTTTAPPSTRTTTTRPTPTTSPIAIPPEIECEYENQFIRDPCDCSVYYQCHDGYPHRFQCAEGLEFDMVYYVCNWPVYVNCTPLSTCP